MLHLSGVKSFNLTETKWSQEEKEIKLEAFNCLSQSFPLPLINISQSEKTPLWCSHYRPFMKFLAELRPDRLHQLGTEPLTITLCLESQLLFNTLLYSTQVRQPS